MGAIHSQLVVPQVQKLMLENESLRNDEASLPNGHDAVSEHHLAATRSTARPVSMFEPRDSSQRRPPIGRKVSHCSNATFRLKTSRGFVVCRPGLIIVCNSNLYT